MVEGLTVDERARLEHPGGRQLEGAGEHRRRVMARQALAESSAEAPSTVFDPPEHGAAPNKRLVCTSLGAWRLSAGGPSEEGGTAHLESCAW